MPPIPTTTTTWIQKIPGVCGGAACVRNTLHTVAGLIQWQRLGLSNARILDQHPDLTDEDLESAWSYDLHNREEIDQAITEDEEA